MYFAGYILVFIITLLATVALEAKLIPKLRRSAAQPIYAEGPTWHLSKSGTPTMGGLGFLIPMLCVGVLCAVALYSLGEAYFASSLLITLAYSAINAIIGIIDDTSKIKKRENAGLTPTEKLIFQGAAAALFLIARTMILGDGTKIYFSFGGVDIGMLYYPISFVMLIATVNCANLTDGIDGLASGVALAVFTVLGALSGGANTEIGILSALVTGGAFGFLTVNLHPAKIFMGDTGSLFFGALAASACVSMGNPFIIIGVGSVYLFEGVSVIVQVIAYKLTGKRVFKMAPFHHHLEKSGWNENKIVIWAIAATLAISLVAARLFV